MIYSNAELIEHLEAIRTELQARRLTPAQYEAVGWADRPLRQLIDQARQEEEAHSWREARSREFTRAVLPGSPIGALLRPLRKCGP